MPPNVCYHHNIKNFNLSLIRTLFSKIIVVDYPIQSYTFIDRLIYTELCIYQFYLKLLSPLQKVGSKGFDLLKYSK